MGHKSLAQIPACLNRPVSSNVRHHKKTYCGHRTLQTVGKKLFTMAKFFIPNAKNQQQAEYIYQSFVAATKAPTNGRRICALAWIGSRAPMSCEVGGELPSRYNTGEEPVLALLDCGERFIICFADSTGIRTDISVKKESSVSVTFFD